MLNSQSSGRGSILPEWLSLDTDFLLAVFEEWGRSLRHYVLNSQSSGGGSILPEWLSLNTDFLLAVFEE